MPTYLIVIAAALWFIVGLLVWYHDLASRDPEEFLSVVREGREGFTHEQTIALTCVFILIDGLWSILVWPYYLIKTLFKGGHAK